MLGIVGTYPRTIHATRAKAKYPSSCCLKIWPTFQVYKSYGALVAILEYIYIYTHTHVYGGFHK